MKYYSIDEKTNEVLLYTLREFDYLDNVTPSYPVFSIIHDVDLPVLKDKETLITVGDRTSYTYNKGKFEITINNVFLISCNVQVVEDHRGEKYYSTQDGSEIEIKDLGSLPPTVTIIPRPDIWHVYIDGEWVMTAEKEAEKAEYEKQQKITSLNEELNQLKQDMIFAQMMGDDISEMKDRVLEIRAELEKLQA